MPRSGDNDTAAYHYTTEKRMKLPTAAETAQAKIREVPPARLQYDPHLPPVLRSDAEARAEVLLEAAARRSLNADEISELAGLLAQHQPWLEWAGKREAGEHAEVPAPPLHIHEFVSAEAILRVAKRQDVERNLFSDFEAEERDDLKSYQHETGWQNRLILGDSLQVMASLSARENLAGKVQMIYMDPPYGIKYASNFQSEVGNSVVSDRDEDLTRESEVVKAYRDTWTLGVHSYLAYLRDRLLAAKALLTDSGSIFVQISDENLHRVRLAMDEVFGSDNFIVLFTFTKKGSQTGDFVPPVNEYIIWFAKDKAKAYEKFTPLYRLRDAADADGFPLCELKTGEILPISSIQSRGLNAYEYRLLSSNALFSQKPGPNEPVELRGKLYPSGGNSWKISPSRVKNVGQANRLLFTDNRVRFKRYADDFAAVTLHNVWGDLAGTSDKRYVVQTNPVIITRCMLMTTDPGDLVLDPTCGSGTTAYVAEQWGRRWITTDTSRVAVAIARQRLLTAKYDFYTLKGDSPKEGFHYKTVPHITLKSIAQNVALDPVFAKWEPVLEGKLRALNAALAETVTPELRDSLRQKYFLKEKRDKRNLTDADRRRWLLPPPLIDINSEKSDADSAGGWREWEVPFDADEEYPDALKAALADYRAAWRGKMDEVNGVIAASAVQEDLVDQPKVERGVLRVSGPFTVEGVIPLESSFDAPQAETPIVGAPEALETFAEEPHPAPGSSEVTPHPNPSPARGEGLSGSSQGEGVNAEAYLERMIGYLRADGVRFPDNRVMHFSRLEPLSGSLIQAAGVWGEGEQEKSVGVSFGPEVGSLTSKQVQECLRTAHRRGYDELVFAAFAFDAAAQALIQENNEDPDATVRPHLAHIAPNTTMGDLLKAPTKRKGEANLQLFTVFGSPRVTLSELGNGEFQVTMEGVDIYDPVKSEILPTRADRVAAWFLDSDYDGRSFCITQAFFPDKTAWEKLAKALKGVVDEERFAALSGTVSLPFVAGENRCAAVKVIDPRGNEVMKVVSLANAQNGGVRYGK